MSNVAELSDHIAGRLPAKLVPVISTDDLVQETLVRAIRDIRNFESRDASSFQSWLKVIADRQIKTAIARRMAAKRSGRRRRQTIPPNAGNSDSVKRIIDKLVDTNETPQRTAQRAEASSAIHVGLASLPDSQRDALQMHDLDGKSIQETARALHRSPNAVRSLIYRARQALRDALGKSSRWISVE
jgi:RNA polymerase sigma-70 factor (ECF subfamily)